MAFDGGRFVMQGIQHYFESAYVDGPRQYTIDYHIMRVIVGRFCDVITDLNLTTGSGCTRWWLLTGMTATLHRTDSGRPENLILELTNVSATPAVDSRTLAAAGAIATFARKLQVYLLSAP